MSWRTKGRYKGLGKVEVEYLREFDRRWDTNSEGRYQQDALDCFRVAKLSKLASIEPTPNMIDFEILNIPGAITRFTVPRATRYGWSIHLILKCGRKVRARFDDRSSAYQAYRAIQEAFSMLLLC